MMKYKILMLLQGEFPPDIRLEKEIKTLNRNNYEVFLLCNKFSKNKGGDYPGVKINRPNLIFSNKKLNKLFNFPIIFNPLFLFFVLKNALRIKPDFIHVHDLPMMPFGVLLKKLLKKPLIFDMHENYPAALISYRKKGILNKIFKNPIIAKRYERKALQEADKVITVVDENKNRLISLGKPPEDIIIVSNTVDLETFAIEQPDKKLVNQFKDKFVILYSGGVTVNRGLDTPIRAIKLLKEKIQNILLLIVGEGDDRERLINLTNNLSLNDYITFVDWPGHDKLSSFFAASQICMIPQPSVESNNTTIPHKLFEYMSQGKPLIVSDTKPLKRIVEETKCGVVFESFNEKDFADKVIVMRENLDFYGRNGKNSVINKYNWALEDSNNLIKLYNSLI